MKKDNTALTADIKFDFVNPDSVGAEHADTLKQNI